MPEAGKRVLLGFDFGTRRIGVAVGQELTGSVTPLTTLQAKNNKPDWQGISKLIEEWQPDLLIVGLPLHLDGQEQPMTDAAKRFGNQLKGRYNLPVEMMDERLSSMEAELVIRERGYDSHDKAQIDKIAAQLILESWLTQQHNA